MEQDGRFELVDGQLEQKSDMGFEAGDTAAIVISRLRAFVSEQKLGKVVTEVSFQCFPNKPSQVRRPDIAFVSQSRLHQVPVHGHVPIPPDLAIEVISPGDLIYKLDRKLRDYKSANIPLVWVFNPDVRIVRVIQAGHAPIELDENAELTGDAVLPGFAAKVFELFPEPLSNV
jgi:Uma2 family endonuclease